MLSVRCPTRGPGRRWLLALGPLALVVWALSAWTMFLVFPDASASSEEQFHHMEMRLAVYQGSQWWEVDVGIYIPAHGETSVEEAYRAARQQMLARFPNAVEIDGGAVRAQYVTTGYSWPEARADWAYNPSAKPGGLSGDSSAMNGGADEWDTAGFEFQGGGATSAGTGACDGSRDSQNTVGWAPQSGSVLAVTCVWHSDGEAFEFDMEFDPDWDWTTGSPTHVDLQSVATHEFGHALGLAHSSVSEAVMYASYTSGTTRRSLHSDDIAGVEAIYGQSSEPTNTPTSTATSTPVPTSTATATSTTTPVSTSTPTDTPTNTPIPTTAVTDTPILPTPSPTALGSPTAVPTSQPTATPTLAGSLPISPGANLVTWTGDEVEPAGVFGNRGNVIRAVYHWDASASQWERYGPRFPSWTNTMGRLRTGEAYWIIATAAAQVMTR